jgi:hypothetical protein
MRLDRRQVILGAAAVVVLGLAAWTFWPAPTPAPQTTVPVQARARAGREPTKEVSLGPTDVQLELLKASRDLPGEAGRNPFRFQPKVVPQPKVVAPPIVPEVTRPVGEPIKPVTPPIPPIALKFVGLLERANGVKWAVLTDGKAVMYGKDGDIIDGKFLIVKIGAESIEMTYTDGRGRQVIRLTGQ